MKTTVIHILFFVATAALIACQNQTSDISAEDLTSTPANLNNSKNANKLVFANYDSVEVDTVICSGNKKVSIKLYATREDAAEGNENYINEEIYCRDGVYFKYVE